ncbi:MAG: DUF4157 domain-containing protein [Methanosarcina sp.]|uniref:eCIS core domain-containing protein n=1 Tax=Methanosarcina sp. TaxID=2213 RepID=UPI00262AFFBB|nr:DUF4157 domain-containing protein [Methanosarcina sp.]MDD3246407.1 DUF4157 domain-containing protein [Methanosarcina sp.]MDD4249575.1 DUF4157 domain-containing protein [Methanosarcina sp.]
MPEHQQIQQSKKPDPTFQKQSTPASQTPVSNPFSIIQRAKINPKSLTHADVMQLQRTIGNRAVGMLLTGIGNTSTVQQAPVQRQEIPEEEEPLQGKMIETIQRQEIPEEEESLQGVFGKEPEGETCPSCMQRQEIPEEEEPLQGKFENKPEMACSSCFAAPVLQRQEIPEEEELLQGKMIGTIQRQEIPEEEESLQGKMIETVQRQEIPEKEETLQGKFQNSGQVTCPSCSAVSLIQKQEMPEEEEPLQGKTIGTIQRQEIPEDEEPLQGKIKETIQRKEIPEEEESLQTKRGNNTGMPDNLKAGVENLSGIDMSDVRVHYNSDKPAEVGALAYTQGTNIHVAPGQEKHLPHEAWHVVQQAQGRVRPTLQMKDISINDDVGLEQEADVMGGMIGNIAETDRKKVSTLGRKETSSLNGMRVTQLAEQVFDREAFENPVDFLKNKRYMMGQIREEIGSSGITGEVQQRLVINLGVSSGWRDRMFADLIAENMNELSQSLRTTVFGITSAERWVREHSLALYNHPNIREKYLSRVRAPRVSQTSEEHGHTYHYDSGRVRITTENLSAVGCNDPNDQRYAMNEANGPQNEGFVKGHLKEFNRKDHMYCDHVHVDKDQSQPIDIYKSRDEFNQAVHYDPIPEHRKDKIRAFLTNVSDIVGRNKREEDARAFLASSQDVNYWSDEARL